MKSKKLSLLAVILVTAILAIAVVSVFFSVAKNPTVTEAEFPFSITYELDGETVNINDVYTVRRSAEDPGVYVGKIGGMPFEDDTIYILKQDESTRVELHTNFYADYMMGASDGDYFDGEGFEPQIYYYDANETEYTDEETLSEQGVKLVSFEYPSPVENKFVFSHITINSNVVFPTLLIALAALLAVVIFVKREESFERKPADMVSVVLNYLITFAALPFISVVAVLVDISDIKDHVLCQIMYFVPALTALFVAVSVGLRRKGYTKSALVSEFTGPVVFAVILAVFGFSGLL